jgi:hypothetical protein
VGSRTGAVSQAAQANARLARRRYAFVIADWRLPAAACDIEAIAVVGHKVTDPVDASQVVTPCGGWRQLIAEAAQLAKRDVRVLIMSSNGERTRIVESTINELKPEALGPANLGLADPREELRARTKRLIALHHKS